MSKKTISHIFFLLDRSGSMQSMASDVVGGFNTFLKEQAVDGDDALMTLIQFDSTDSHEVLAQSVPISKVKQLTSDVFIPRGGTPLYDAIGHAIGDATIRLEAVKSDTDTVEEVIFVVYTDGEENQSREYTQEKIFELIKKRQESGWTFVFLGADQDAYQAGGRIGLSVGNTQNFAADGEGNARAFSGLSKSMVRERGKMRMNQVRNKADFFENDKDAEADLAKRAD